MTGKIPNMNYGLGGVVQTQTPVQFGCVYCLGESLQAPAENHVAYLWSGTSMCAKHFKSKVMEAQRA